MAEQRGLCPAVGVRRLMMIKISRFHIIQFISILSRISPFNSPDGSETKRTSLAPTLYNFHIMCSYVVVLITIQKYSKEAKHLNSIF